MHVHNDKLLSHTRSGSSYMHVHNDKLLCSRNVLFGVCIETPNDNQCVGDCSRSKEVARELVT